MNTVASISRRAVTRLLAPLDKPIKRLGFLVLIAGILLLAYSLLAISNVWDWYNRAPPYLRDLWLAAIRDYDTVHGYRAAWGIPACWGVWLVIAGAIFSYGYDRTIGKLARWVRRG